MTPFRGLKGMTLLMRRLLRLTGLVLLVLGSLYACGMIDRGDRQIALQHGSAETVMIHDRWAPGLGLGLIAAGAFALWLGRRREHDGPPA